MNIKGYRVYKIFILALISFGCSNSQDNNFEVLNNGLISIEKLKEDSNHTYVTNDKTLLNYSAKKARDIEGLKVEVSYISSAMKFEQEYGDLEESNIGFFEEYSNKEFFTFKIAYKSEKDPLKSEDLQLEYSKAIQYLTDRIRNDISIEVEGKKLVNPEMIVFERTYGVRPFLLINVVFDKNKTKGSRKFMYFDKLFGKGFIKIDFSSIEEGII